MLDRDIKPFNPNSFYYIATDSEIVEGENRYLKLSDEGFIYLMDYFARQYQTRIFVVQDVKGIISTIDSLKEIPGDLRISFVMGGPYSGHSVHVSYLREKDNEALLVADSKGLENSVSLVNELTKESQMKVLNIEDVRQSDLQSCHLDALLFGRDITAKNPDGNYRLPNLLTRLLARQSTTTAIDFVKLIDELYQLSTLADPNQVENSNQYSEFERLLLKRRSTNESAITKMLQELLQSPEFLFFLQQAQQQNLSQNEIMKELDEKFPKFSELLKQPVPDTFDITKLIDELLKTSQISKFTTHHREPQRTTPVHKAETLDQFHKRFTEKVTIKPSNEKTQKSNIKKEINAYLRQKSIKAADTIEIQFYLVQLREIFKEQWSKEIEEQFIKGAKVILKEQGNALNINRKGLYDYVVTFKNQNLYTNDKLLTQMTSALSELCYPNNKTSIFNKIAPKSKESDMHFTQKLKEILMKVHKNLVEIAPNVMALDIMHDRLKVIEKFIDKNFLKELSQSKRTILNLEGKDKDKEGLIADIFKEALTHNNFSLKPSSDKIMTV